MSSKLQRVCCLFYRGVPCECMLNSSISSDPWLSAVIRVVTIVFSARHQGPDPFVVSYQFYGFYLLPSLHERLLVFIQRLQDFAKVPFVC